ncbi:MAG TPA: hypothetical protein VFW46_14870, partial [Stellaceae bacterium]|nr:hypothetical protein [Stellaceae bacterium]
PPKSIRCSLSSTRSLTAISDSRRGGVLGSFTEAGAVENLVSPFEGVAELAPGLTDDRHDVVMSGKLATRQFSPTSMGAQSGRTRLPSISGG